MEGAIGLASEAQVELPSSTPLRHHIWQMHCEGETYSSIALQLGLDRQTVTRHVQAVQQMLAEEHKHELVFARLRAVEAQHRIQAEAWRGLRAEEQREGEALADPEAHTPYRAQRARLLNVAGIAAFRAARLLGLCERSAPAPEAPEDQGPRTVLIVRDEVAGAAAEEAEGNIGSHDEGHEGDEGDTEEAPCDMVASSPADAPSEHDNSGQVCEPVVATDAPEDDGLANGSAGGGDGGRSEPYGAIEVVDSSAALLTHEKGLEERILSLHPAQHAFVTSSAPYAFYVGGLGAGKTFAGALRALLHAQAAPGSLGLVGAPTERMLRDATIRMLLDLLPADLLTCYHKTEGRLVLANGAEILLRSLDAPDRVRGLNLAWFWLDEAPLAGHYAWQLLKGRLRQAEVDPAQLAGWATGTPRGRDGFARDFELEPLPGHALFRASTAENAAHLPPGYLDALLHSYQGAFADQELRGLFTAFAGLVYQLDTVSAPPAGHLRAPDPGMAFTRAIGGIDWGYTNPTAALVFGLDGDGRAWQLAEFYRRRATLEADALPALVALSREHRVAVWYADPSQPAYLAALNAALAQAGLSSRARAATTDILPSIQTVTAALALRPDGTRGLYLDPSCTATLAEYQTYAYATAPDGDASDRTPAVGGRGSELPLKEADHAMDATRYALHSKLAGYARTEAYLADLQRRLALQRESAAGRPLVRASRRLLVLSKLSVPVRPSRVLAYSGLAPPWPSRSRC